jgi:hypothetical protein
MNQIGKIAVDIVTLIRYMLGTVKKCDSGGAPKERPPFSLRQEPEVMLVVPGSGESARKVTKPEMKARPAHASCSEQLASALLRQTKSGLPKVKRS